MPNQRIGCNIPAYNIPIQHIFCRSKWARWSSFSSPLCISSNSHLYFHPAPLPISSPTIFPSTFNCTGFPSNNIHRSSSCPQLSTFTFQLSYFPRFSGSLPFQIPHPQNSPFPVIKSHTMLPTRKRPHVNPLLSIPPTQNATKSISPSCPPPGSLARVIEIYLGESLLPRARQDWRPRQSAVLPDHGPQGPHGRQPRGRSPRPEGRPPLRSSGAPISF